MDAQEIALLLKKERTIYDAEVAGTLESRLHLLLAHLYLEHLLERYIQIHLKDTKGLFGQGGLTFAKKVVLSRSVGKLTPQIVDAILKVNGLRNDMAHRFGHRITSKEVDDLGGTLGRSYTKLKFKNGRDKEALLRASCAYLCGKMARIVVEAENA